MAKWLDGGGQMAERIRNHDWAATPLGPLQNWPDPLKTSLALCLASRFPQAVLWGPDLLTLHNDAFSQILGQKPLALGIPFREVWKEAWADIGSMADRALAGEAVYIEDFPLTIDRNGGPERAHFTFCYSPIRDHDGNVLGMLDTVTETTASVLAHAEVREAMAALEALNATLEQRVEERTTQLLHTEAVLRQTQKLEAIGQLTGGVAHDFNNLLTIIRSSLHFLQRPNLDEKRRERYLKTISDTVDRGTKLTGQLLAFARRQALSPQVFEAGPRLEAMADMLDTATGARIQVELQLPQAPCHIRADLNQLETAVINLMLNGRDAMAGAGTLQLCLQADQCLPALRGQAPQPGPFAAISVSDSGVGIAADLLERIFDPFFTTKAPGEGTGLGLSQVFGFAKQSGGDVQVNSVPGQGTTFTLYLPQEPPPAV